MVVAGEEKVMKNLFVVGYGSRASPALTLSEIHNEFVERREDTAPCAREGGAKKEAGTHKSNHS